jgi:hypothetical protein
MPALSYDEWDQQYKVPQLRDLCTQRHLPTTGNKKQLIRRLMAPPLEEATVHLTPMQQVRELPPHLVPAQFRRPPAFVLPGVVLTCRARFPEKGQTPPRLCGVPGATFCEEHRTFDISSFVYSRARLEETLAAHQYVWLQAHTGCFANDLCKTKDFSAADRALANLSLHPCATCPSLWCFFIDPADNALKTCLPADGLRSPNTDLVGCAPCTAEDLPHRQAAHAFPLRAAEQKLQALELAKRQAVALLPAAAHAPDLPRDPPHLPAPPTQAKSVKAPFACATPGAWPVLEIDKDHQTMVRNTSGKSSPLALACGVLYESLVIKRKTAQKLLISDVPLEMDKIYRGFADVAAGLRVVAANVLFDEYWRTLVTLNADQIDNTSPPSRDRFSSESRIIIILYYNIMH